MKKKRMRKRQGACMDRFKSRLCSAVVPFRRSHERCTPCRGIQLPFVVGQTGLRFFGDTYPHCASGYLAVYCYVPCTPYPVRSSAKGGQGTRDEDAEILF